MNKKAVINSVESLHKIHHNSLRADGRVTVEGNVDWCLFLAGGCGVWFLGLWEWRLLAGSVPSVGFRYYKTTPLFNT